MVQVLSFCNIAQSLCLKKGLQNVSNPSCLVYKVGSFAAPRPQLLGAASVVPANKRLRPVLQYVKHMKAVSSAFLWHPTHKRYVYTCSHTCVFILVLSNVVSEKQQMPVLPLFTLFTCWHVYQASKTYKSLTTLKLNLNQLSGLLVECLS